jgi:hypothetical protein
MVKKKTTKTSTKKASGSKKTTHTTKTHAVKQTSKGMPTWAIVGSVVLAVIVVAAIIAIGIIVTKSNLEKENTVTGEVVLDMYVMSQCPYGAQAETEAIKAVKRFGDDIDYNIHYIVRSQGDSFSSLHGQAEVDENIRQLCIKENYPEKYLDYLLCFNQNYQAGETQFLRCAQEQNVNLQKITDCAADEGVQYLKASEVETNKVGASASPTIYLDGASYSGGRSETDFARAICEKFNYEHEGCADIPKPVALNVMVLTSKNCPTCDTTQITSASKQLFPGATFEYVDADTEQGQALIEEYSLVYLPAYIFEDKLVETNTWETNTQLRGAFVQKGTSFQLRDESSGANWFIDKEKQNEFFASIGVVKGDNKPQIDFFVMSYCPYGNQAEEAIAPVFDQLKGKADFNPRYVIYSNYGSGYPDYCLDEANVICSMHGIQELHQNIREACVAKYYGSQEWFDFALAMNTACSASNADTCWTAVAESQELDVAKIRTCQTDEGYDLMLADKTLGDKLGVQGSPTVFIDGSQYAGSRTANGFLNGLCAGFDTSPSECANAVAEPTQAAAPAGGSC